MLRVPGQRRQVEDGGAVRDRPHERGNQFDRFRDLDGGRPPRVESAAGTPIFGAPDPDGTVDGADEMAPDGKNEILFASIAEPGTVAVRMVWGVFSGPPFGRELVEWDMVLDGDLTWGNAGPGNETALGDTA